MDRQTQSDWARAIPAKEQVGILRRLLHYLKNFKAVFGLAMVGAFLVSVINMALPYGLHYFLDHFLVKQQATLAVIIWAAALYGLGSLLKAALQFGYEYGFALGAEKTLESLRSALYHHLHKLGLRYFDQTPAGAIVSRVTNDTSTLSNFASLLATLIVSLFSIITAFVAMFETNTGAGFLMLVFVPLMRLLVWYYNKRSSRLYRCYRQQLSQINTSLNETISGVSLIQQFKQEKRMSRLFEKNNQGLMKTRFNMIRLNSLLLSPLTSMLYSLALMFTLAWFGFPLQQTFVPAGVLYAFSQYLSQLFNPLSNLMDQLTIFQDGIVSGRRIFRILDEDEYAPTQGSDKSLQVEQGKIEFKHVSFSYDGKNEILHDVSFTVEPGQTLGIVGHTGSGKSSIINVMMRFYEFQKGQILLDGVDIRSYTKEELRKKLGLVLQDPFMFYGDVAFNVRLYDQNISDQAIKKACQMVQADRFIAGMPQGYHSQVNEGGSELSQGQRQLLSFARALVRDPKILVLDEATANVDTETETMIQQGLRKLREGRTTLAIAHRLSTIADADQIIVLDKGCIVERGTHEQLLAQHGYYYKLYTLQQHSK